MRVSKLIKKLEKLPPSAEVVAYFHPKEPYWYHDLKICIEDVDGRT